MDKNEIITVAALLAFAILLLALWGIDRRRRGHRRSGVGVGAGSGGAGSGAMSGFIGTFDEVFHPEAARAVEIREVQHELPLEAPDSEGPLPS